MSDDFFDKIDAELGAQKAAKATKKRASDTNLAFFKTVMPQLAVIAERYAHKCRERGMSAEVSHGDYSVTFTLRYARGQKRTLVGSLNHDLDNRLGFTAHWPGNDGKPYTFPPKDLYDKARWSDDRYEAQLEQTIEEFTSDAVRFGGI